MPRKSALSKMGMEGPLAGTAPPRDPRERIKQALTLAGTVLGGMVLGFFLNLPFLNPLGILVALVVVSRWRGVDLRLPVTFALLAAVVAASMVTARGISKPTRAVTAQANQLAGMVNGGVVDVGRVPLAGVLRKAGLDALADQVAGEEPPKAKPKARAER
jgi:hypothetical protein